MRSLFFIVLTLAAPSLAWDLRTDSEGDVVKWTKKVELVLEIDAPKKLEEAAAEKAIRQAVEHLREHTPYLEVSLSMGEALPMGYRMGEKNQNSIVVLDEWPYAAGTLAVTLVTLNARTNELLDADVAFNIEEHRFSVLPEKPGRETNLDDVQNTVTHELGHVLGLMHNAVAEDLVMYPSAPPGEVVKRVLKGDDKDGLLALYGVAPPPAALAPPVAVGCSASSGSASPALVLVVLMFLLLRGRRSARLAAVVASVPALVLAAEPALPKAVETAEQVAVSKVVGSRAFTHPSQPGLIVTELELRPVECLKGACAGGPQRLTVIGGRVGDVEQVAVHQPVPRLDEQVLTVTRLGRTRALWVQPAERVAIVHALRAQTRSASPQGTTAPPSAPAQVGGIAP